MQGPTVVQGLHTQADDLAQLNALVGGDGDFTHQFDLVDLGGEIALLLLEFG